MVLPKNEGATVLKGYIEVGIGWSGVWVSPVYLCVDLQEIELLLTCGAGKTKNGKLMAALK